MKYQLPVKVKHLEGDTYVVSVKLSEDSVISIRLKRSEMVKLITDLENTLKEGQDAI